MEEGELDEVLIENEISAEVSEEASKDVKLESNLVIEEIKEEKLPYLEKVRKYGAGEIRINTRLDVDEDIYSLAFVSMLSDECITPYFDVIKGELINLSSSDSEGE